ncbi:choice-of-anchor D domain-containing protein [Usitatibacter palustris]|uniref:Periplasmic copper-binding protein NosD beta helix domain-containing protein n=1 Tax=Usitatibacter palustris TaxID=2732487 RepID=A0A6M4H9U8_9PROT|nr:choice-of-anchor D domain-containing protein [Usitatibacter palustris]QJR15955.1 hypothetical protein DSM104440_02783 [Usitatibacter palustris]
MRTAPSGSSARLFRQSSLALAIAAALPVYAGDYMVTNTGDNGGVNPAPLAGTGTLRQAIVDANAACVTLNSPSIGFAIPAAPFQITPASPLPFLSCMGSSTFSPTIDATAQPGVTIDGATISALQITSCGIEFDPYGYGGTLTLRGLKIQSYSYGGYSAGVCAKRSIVKDNQFVGNAYGIKAGEELTALGNTITSTDTGIEVGGNATVGGSTAADRNVINGGSRGVKVQGAGTVMIQGNYIGTDASGNAVVPISNGIEVYFSDPVTIDNNVIAGGSNGIYVGSQDSITISNNKIGVGASGGSLTNGTGIQIGYSGPPSMVVPGMKAVGGLTSKPLAAPMPNAPANLIYQNTIANGANSGVYVTNGNGIKISENAIYNNSPKNIDLAHYAGPVANDALDTDTGINGLQNNPVVTSFTVEPGVGATVNYSLNSTPGSTFILEFFASGAVGAREGLSFLGAVTATTDSSGDVSGTTPVFPGSPSFVSATARHGTIGDTSEFSAAVAVTPTASATVSSSMLDFGNVPIGTSGTLASTITSQGSAPWLITSAGSPTCYGGPAYYGGPIACGGPFTCTSSCSSGSSYSSGSSCSVTATFSPGSLGTFNASLQICDNTTSSPRTISLTGVGTAALVPGVSTSTNTIDFGNVPIGSTVGPMNAVLTSSGTAPWMLSAIGSPTCYGGPVCYGGPFTCTSTCAPGQYSPGSTCQLDATFSPVSPGLWSVNVEICDNAAGSPRTILVKGNGFVPGTPTVSQTTTTLNFGPVPLGASSGTQTATFTSSSALPWMITSQGSPTCYGGPICSGGGFTCATTCTPGTSYSLGQSCKVDAFFTPTALGPQSVTVEFCDNAPGSPHTLVLNAEGVVPPAVTLSPAAHDFGPVPVGTSTPFTFNLSNPSPSALFIGNVVTTGPFSVLSTTCTPSMGPSGSCNAVVVFTPTVNGYVTGTVGPSAFPSAASTLVGQGLTSAQLQLPPPIEFPAYTLGQPALSRIVALKNTGQLPLTITSIAVSAPFTLTHDCPTTPMPPDATCLATIGFSPTTIGNFVGSFTVVSNSGGGTTQFVPIRASSQPRPAPSLVVTPREVGFGGRGVGSLSPAQSVGIRNIGGATAIIDSLVTSADFVVLGHNCATLAPLAECTASVAMQANSFGLRVGTLTIRSNAENGTETVLLSGTGCRPPGISAGRLGAITGGC